MMKTLKCYCKLFLLTCHLMAEVPLKPVWTLALFSWTLFFFDYKQSNLPREADTSLHFLLSLSPPWLSILLFPGLRISTLGDPGDKLSKAVNPLNFETKIFFFNFLFPAKDVLRYEKRLRTCDATPLWPFHKHSSGLLISSKVTSIDHCTRDLFDPRIFFKDGQFPASFCQSRDLNHGSLVSEVTNSTNWATTTAQLLWST